MAISRIVRFSLAVGLGALVGCANHIKEDSHTETEVERVKISQVVDIQTDAGSLVTVPLINVEAHDSQTFKVKTIEAKSDYDVVTPYQGVRELYEFPMGLVLLPVGIVVNVVDIVLLGLLPDSVTDAPIDWAFAGMNPFLNIESDDRTERTLKKSDKKVIDEKEEFLKKPLAGKPLQVSSGGARVDLNLDENGKAEVSLVRLSALTAEVDRVSLMIDAGDKPVSRDIDVSRQLRSQLQQASAITQKYAALAASEITAEDIRKLDLAAFSADLIALSKLGFESESLRIEQKALSLMGDDQKLAFKTEMDKALRM